MKKIKICCFFLFTAILCGCTETYELKTKNFESLLVVEGTLTNEMKKQEIKLSRTYRLEDEGPNTENDAQVRVETNGHIYDFSEQQPGIYLSDEVFQAVEGQSYKLQIQTQSGKTYQSAEEFMPSVVEIGSLTPVLATALDVEGVQVLVNAPNVGEAIYFKYDYEETYKIVTPFYKPIDLEISNVENFGETYDLSFVPKPEDTSTCYATKTSTDIIQTSLDELDVTSVVNFPVRFINKNNSILRERYSILVKQYVQSFDAYNFYKILKELGTVENLFTESQPGFIQGNITSTQDADEDVIGFFQVSSVSSKRIFFYYGDFNVPKPPYLYECVFNDADYNDNTGIDMDPNERQFMYDHLLPPSDIKYYEGDFPVYTFVNIECGDCTSFSSTTRPDFWED